MLILVRGTFPHVFMGSALHLIQNSSGKTHGF